jgi:hypothetical protein
MLRTRKNVSFPETPGPTNSARPAERCASHFKGDKMSKYQYGKKEPKPEDIKVTLTLKELNDLIDKMDDALDGDSNDYEHDVLYATRDTLSEYTSDPDRRIDE